MDNFIKNKKVLAAFSDTAGAKSILSYLNIYGPTASNIIAITNRNKSIYDEFV